MLPSSAPHVVLGGSPVAAIPHEPSFFTMRAVALSQGFWPLVAPLVDDAPPSPSTTTVPPHPTSEPKTIDAMRIERIRLD